MEMQRVWAVYFSGTGTTEKVVTRMAKIAAEDLGAEYKTFCFNLPKDREGELSFGPGDLVIFGTPVYAGRVPNLLLPYIRDKVKGNGALAVPVSLFGNRNFDDGLIELRNVLEADGFHTVAGGAFVGELSFSRTLGAGRPAPRVLEKESSPTKAPPATVWKPSASSTLRSSISPSSKFRLPNRDTGTARAPFPFTLSRI